MQAFKKTGQKIEYMIFGVLLVVLTGLTLYLTYHQAWYAINHMTDTGYHSDILAYMQEAQGIDSGYNFPYPILFLLTRIFHLLLPIEWSISLVVTGLHVCSFVALRYYFNKYLQKAVVKEWMPWQKVFVDVVAFLVLFYSMIFVYNHPFPGTRFYYMGVFSPNPFHNATYQASRPVAIICVFLFADLLETYEQKLDLKKAVAFSAMLLLATMTKPSFTIVFSGTAGLIMLCRLVKSKGSNFKNTILLGCMFLPTFADLLYQYSGVFTGTDSKGQEAGLGVELFRVWREYCSNYFVAIVLMIFFPLVVLAFQYRKILSNTLYRFGWQIYVVSLAMFSLLYEKGFRAVDANFSWGYMLGAFFLVMSSLMVLVEETYKAGKHNWGLLIQWGAFGLHVLCGVFYFMIIFTGGSYY